MASLLDRITPELEEQIRQNAAQTRQTISPNAQQAAQQPLQTRLGNINQAGNQAFRQQYGGNTAGVRPETLQTRLGNINQAGNQQVRSKLGQLSNARPGLGEQIVEKAAKASAADPYLSGQDAYSKGPSFKNTRAGKALGKAGGLLSSGAVNALSADYANQQALLGALQNPAQEGERTFNNLGTGSKAVGDLGTGLRLMGSLASRAPQYMAETLANGAPNLQNEYSNLADYAGKLYDKGKGFVSGLFPDNVQELPALQGQPKITDETGKGNYTDDVKRLGAIVNDPDFTKKYSEAEQKMYRNMWADASEADTGGMVNQPVETGIVGGGVPANRQSQASGQLNIFGQPLQPEGFKGWTTQNGMTLIPWDEGPTLESLAYALPAAQYRELAAKGVGSYDDKGNFSSLGGFNPAFSPEQMALSQEELAIAREKLNKQQAVPNKFDIGPDGRTYATQGPAAEADYQRQQAEALARSVKERRDKIASQFFLSDDEKKNLAEADAWLTKAYNQYPGLMETIQEGLK